MKRLFNSVLFAAISLWSCTTPSAAIESIWLPEGLTWNSSNTGQVEIDSLREESFAEMLVFFNDRLSYGDASLFKYRNGDSTALVYESGEMLLTVKECLPVKDTSNGKALETSKYSIEFIDENRLKFSDKIFKRADRFNNRSKKDLSLEMVKKCP